MPAKLLSRANPAAATNTTLYTVPALKQASFLVSLCNRGASPVKVRLALSDTATPALADYLEFDTTIPANSVLERGGLASDAGKLVVVYSDIATVSAVAVGYEE